MPQSKTNSLRELIMTFPANDSHKFHSFYFSLCLSFKRFSFEKKYPLICNILESLGFTSFHFFQISFYMNVPIDFLKFCHINFEFFFFYLWITTFQLSNADTKIETFLNMSLLKQRRYFEKWLFCTSLLAEVHLVQKCLNEIHIQCSLRSTI